MLEQAVKRQLKRVEGELATTLDQLKVAHRELEAVRREQRKSGTADGAPERAFASPGKLAAIDYAVEKFGVESFVSLEIGRAYGQYAFYAIDKPHVQRGALVNVGPQRSGDYLLSAIEQAAERPGMALLDSGYADPATVRMIEPVDAVLLFDVLHRMSAPDWNEVLELYAPVTSCFVIANPQWERDERTVRLTDLGRDAFLQAVPPWLSHEELFGHADGAPQGHRDATDIWQWGITDRDLQQTMERLGFTLERDWQLNPPPKTEGFVNKAFVFKTAGS